MFCLHGTLTCLPSERAGRVQQHILIALLLCSVADVIVEILQLIDIFSRYVLNLSVSVLSVCTAQPSDAVNRVRLWYSERGSSLRNTDCKEEVAGVGGTFTIS